jgi:hypothetical protein
MQEIGEPKKFACKRVPISQCNINVAVKPLFLNGLQEMCPGTLPDARRPRGGFAHRRSTWFVFNNLQRTGRKIGSPFPRPGDCRGRIAIPRVPPKRPPNHTLSPISSIGYDPTGPAQAIPPSRPIYARQEIASPSSLSAPLLPAVTRSSESLRTYEPVYTSPIQSLRRSSGVYVKSEYV